MPHSVITAVITSDPQVHEDIHVHEVYDRIASHFSSTRYKPWPIITQFLSRLPTGWVGLDSGTGNGKYLPLPLDRPGGLWTIGLDRSRNLLHIARNAGGGEVVREVVWGDVLGYGWRGGVFDYAISIATIHHLATHERRKLAMKRLIQCVSSTHGRILVYVWAIEQDEFSKRRLPTDRQETTGAGSRAGQDVFVPWVLSQQIVEKPESKTSDPHTSAPISKSAEQINSPNIVNRYYHMFAQGELVDLASSAATELGLEVGLPPLRDKVDSASIKTRGMTIVQDGWERSNYYVELQCWEL